MNAAAVQARRLAVSPYARRLARERALPLETLRGSGPGGRILAADVLSFAAPPRPVGQPAVEAAPASPSVAVSSIAAFATSIALGALKDLLAALESTGRMFDIDDVLLRAAGRAFAESPDIDRGADACVALELPGRQAVFATVPEISLTSMRAARLASLRGDRDDAGKFAVLSLRLLPASSIRPIMMPLLPGRAMRLAVSLDTAGNQAECLLITDASSVDESNAAAWLATLKSTLEHPLRLFV
ncbi:MAG: hypothetical protein EOS71_26010 [Mesorhizobium sp.]|nr:hypothetical protein EOA35_07480 [Mesorhizobium sp. M8A.F.Ca.ET.023.01.1.1]RWC70310.1 MAG: hypothetical protein EOS71_26010 [Mesorhizobium sp.]